MTQFNEMYSYKIEDNGYSIYRNGELFITQYDEYSKPFDKDASFEENCVMQINDLIEAEKQANMFENLKKAVEEGNISEEFFEQITGVKYEDVSE